MNVSKLDVVPEVSEAILLKIFFVCLPCVISPSLSSRLLIGSSVLSNLLFVPSSEF